MIQSKKRKPSILRPNSRRNRNDARSIRYLRFVRMWPCCVTFKDIWDRFLEGELSWQWMFQLGSAYACSEACHIGGNSAAKSYNYSAIPLTKYWHTGDNPGKKNAHSEHALKRDFAEFHNISIEAIQAKIYECFLEWEATQ